MQLNEHVRRIVDSLIELHEGGRLGTTGHLNFHLDSAVKIYPYDPEIVDIENTPCLGTNNLPTFHGGIIDVAHAQNRAIFGGNTRITDHWFGELSNLPTIADYENYKNELEHYLIREKRLFNRKHIALIKCELDFISQVYKKIQRDTLRRESRGEKLNYFYRLLVDPIELQRFLDITNDVIKVNPEINNLEYRDVWLELKVIRQMFNILLEKTRESGGDEQHLEFLEKTSEIEGMFDGPELTRLTSEEKVKEIKNQYFMIIEDLRKKIPFDIDDEICCDQALERLGFNKENYTLEKPEDFAVGTGLTHESVVKELKTPKGYSIMFDEGGDIYGIYTPNLTNNPENKLAEDYEDEGFEFKVVVKDENKSDEEIYNIDNILEVKVYKDDEEYYFDSTGELKKVELDQTEDDVLDNEAGMDYRAKLDPVVKETLTKEEQEQHDRALRQADRDQIRTNILGDIDKFRQQQELQKQQRNKDIEKDLEQGRKANKELARANQDRIQQQRELEKLQRGERIRQQEQEELRKIKIREIELREKELEKIKKEQELEAKRAKVAMQRGADKQAVTEARTKAAQLNAQAAGEVRNSRPKNGDGRLGSK